jgi:hypothetical protein
LFCDLQLRNPFASDPISTANYQHSVPLEQADDESDYESLKDSKRLIANQALLDGLFATLNLSAVRKSTKGKAAESTSAISDIPNEDNDDYMFPRSEDPDQATIVQVFRPQDQQPTHPFLNDSYGANSSQIIEIKKEFESFGDSPLAEDEPEIIHWVGNSSTVSLIHLFRSLVTSPPQGTQVQYQLVRRMR